MECLKINVENRSRQAEKWYHSSEFVLHIGDTSPFQVHQEVLSFQRHKLSPEMLQFSKQSF